MYIDMDERIAGKQDRSSMIIEDPPQGPFLHFGLYMKNKILLIYPKLVFWKILTGFLI